MLNEPIHPPVPPEHSPKQNPPTIDTSRIPQTSILERIRRSPFKRPLAAVLALAAHIPLYLPKQLEPKAPDATTEGSAHELRLSEEDVQELLSSQREVWDSLDVTFDEPHQAHIVTIDPDAPGEFSETMVPGAHHHLELRIQTDWAGRQGERGAQMSTGEEEAIRTDATKVAQEIIQSFALLELDADSSIREIYISAIGHSSPEGPDRLNQEASQWRADIVAQAITEAFESAGIDSVKITVQAEGHGAEGTIGEFVQALSETGTPIAGSTPQQQEAGAISLIRQIHDAPDTVPTETVHTFQTDLASHRSVDLIIDVEGYDALLRTPLSTVEADPIVAPTLAYLDYYDPAERARNMPYIVEPPGGFPPPIETPPGTPVPPEPPEPPVPPTPTGRPPERPPVRSPQPVEPPATKPPVPPEPPVPPVPPTPTGRPPERPPVRSPQPVEPPATKPPVPPEPPVPPVPPTPTGRPPERPPVPPTEPTSSEPPEPPIGPIILPPNEDPPDPPVGPDDDPPPPPRRKGVGKLKIKDPAPKPVTTRRSPGHQTASGLGPTKGAHIGHAPSRSRFGKSAKKHHTGKRNQG